MTLGDVVGRLDEEGVGAEELGARGRGLARGVERERGSETNSVVVLLEVFGHHRLVASERFLWICAE